MKLALMQSICECNSKHSMHSTACTPSACWCALLAVPLLHVSCARACWSAALQAQHARHPGQRWAHGGSISQGALV